MKMVCFGIVGAIFLNALPISAALAGPDVGVAYQVSPSIKNGSLEGLEVELRFRGDPTGVTTLDLPDHAGGHRELWRNLRDLAVIGAISVTEPDPAHRVIRAPPNAPLNVRYRVVSGIDHEPNQDDREPFTPWIRPTWFYAVGEAVFVTPHDHDSAPASFDWAGAPPDFTFASDLEHLAGKQRNATRPGTVDDIVESVLLGGSDVKIIAHEDRGAPVRVAMRGTYQFTEPQFFDPALKIIEDERNFWSEQGSPFLITLAPLAAHGGSSMSGTGRTDAFLLALTPDITLAQLRYLLAHEYFHTWNPRALGKTPDGPDQKLDYWFSEGFTDFYARPLLRRYGLTTSKDFADEWNEMLLAYASSPVRTEPNQRIKSDFWKDENVEKLPYERGAMLAAIWNARLEAMSGGRISLDDVLHAQRDVVLSGKSGSESPVTLFPSIAASFGLDVRDDVARYVERGDAITLPPDVFGPCVRVSNVTQPRFDRGYDVEATSQAGNVVTGLRVNSSAYAAGLRNGMKILKREAGSPGDSSVPYTFRVNDGGQERLISFSPAGSGYVTFQRLTRRTDLKGCR